MASTFETLLLAQMAFALNPPVMWCNQGSTTQSITLNTQTALTFTANTVDTYSGHSTSSNTADYFFQVPGLYYVQGSIYVQSLTAAVSLFVGYNGTPVVGSKQTVNFSAGAGSVSTSGLVTATAAGDFCSIIAYSTANATTAATTGTSGAGPNQSTMMVQFIHV